MDEQRRPPTSAPDLGVAPDAVPVRGAGSTLDFDVVMQGTVFLDIVLTGLAALPSAGTEVPGRGHGLVPRRHRQSGDRGQPAGAADLVGLVVRRRPLRRLPGQHPGGGGNRPVAVQADQSMAFTGDGLAGGGQGPRDDHPQPPVAGLGRPADSEDAQYRGRGGAPRAGRAGVGSGGPGPRHAAVRRCRLGRHRTVVHGHHRADGPVARVPAQLRRSHGLHPDRRSQGRADAVGRRGPGGGDHLRWAGRDRRGFDDRRGGVGALAAGERGGRHRRR